MAEPEGELPALPPAAVELEPVPGIVAEPAAEPAAPAAAPNEVISGFLQCKLFISQRPSPLLSVVSLYERVFLSFIAFYSVGRFSFVWFCLFTCP